MSRRDRFLSFASQLRRGKAYDRHTSLIRSSYARRLRMEELEERCLLAITVDSLVDEADGSIVDGDISLRDAIAAATSGETIDFSVTGVIALNNTLGELTIDKPLTIDGPGANQLAIDGNDPTPGNPNGDGIRIFNVDDSSGIVIDVEISGLTLRGGDVSGNGGAISSLENLTLVQSTLSGNAASNKGGGAYNYGNLIIRDSTLSGNAATNYGGAISNSNYGGTTTITNSTLSGNTANFGGAIANNGFSYAADVSHSTITGNTANIGGGGIYNTASVTLSHTIVAGNTSTASSRIEIDNFGTVVVNDYNLLGDSSNTTIGALGFGVTPGATDVTATSDGTNPTALTEILDTTLANNGGPTATHALALPFSPAIDAGDPLFDPTVFTPSLANDQRGASFDRVVDFLGGGSRIDIGAFEQSQSSANFFVVNTTVDELDFANSDTSLREAIAWTNFLLGADTITFDPSVFATPRTIAIGSQLPTIVEDLTITGPGQTLLTIDAGDGPNNLPSDGDGYRIFNIDVSGSTIDVAISGVTLTGGDTSDPGGAIFNVENLTITNTTVRDNSAQAGGGVFNFGGDMIVTNSTIAGNSVSTSGGGGITNTNSSQVGNTTINNSTITGNSAGGGGGIINYGMTTVTNSTISGNSAIGSGGGINNFSGSTIVINTTMTGNSAGVNGGGIGSGGLATVTSSIVANSASGGDLFSTTSFTGSNNLIEDGSGPGLTGTITGDPLLGPLADNGGPTQTHALLPGSPALDMGSSTESNDQRGLTRNVGGVDIGAYEAQSAPSADFVDNDLIDGADFLAWQRGFGTTVGATRADGNSDDDGDVDASDLAAWMATYGQVETTPLVAATSSERTTAAVTFVRAAIPAETTPAVAPNDTEPSSAELVDAALAWMLANESETMERWLLEEVPAISEIPTDFAFARDALTSTAASHAENAIATSDDDAESTDNESLADKLLASVFG